MCKNLLSVFLLFTTFSAISQSLIEIKEKLLINNQNIISTINSRTEQKNIALSANPNFNFTIVENDVINGILKEENPEIKTFDVLVNGEKSGSFTYSPQGIWAFYKKNGQNISISPDWSSPEHQRYHIVKYGVQNHLLGDCGVDQQGKAVDFATFRKIQGNRANFTQKRIYRMAVVATGEFTLANGGTVASAKAAITASVNGISDIYERQFGIEFNLVSSVAFPDPNTDPFIPDNSGGQGRTIQAGTQIPLAFPGANNTYDIAHVVHTHNDDGSDGWSNGGLALLESVCDNGVNNGALNKASGWSGSFSNNDFGWLSLFAHEVGHQFAMTHTFNGTGESCTDNISLTTAVEIGSGTTIMSYNGSCQANNNVQSNGEFDLYFHYVNALQIAQYIFDLELSGVGCALPTNTTNHHPEGNANPCNVATYAMPKGTAFYLKAEATDEDGDVVYHAWEQFDEDGDNNSSTQGNIGGSAASKKRSPLFKNYPPSITNERYFPDVQTVIQGLTSDPFQVLPTTDRVISFAYSARDNNVAKGGGLVYEEILINVGTTGPLTLTYPNANDTLTPGETFNATWENNGSEALCDSARISLSTDGGNSFPIILANNIDYALGSQSVTLPKSLNLSTTARIKIECADYDCFKFYDISNADFRIESNCAAPTSIICPSNDLIFEENAPALDLNLEFKAGTKVTRLSKNITDNSGNLGRVIIYNQTQTGCANISNYYRVSTIVSVDKTGLYSFEVDKDFGEGSGFITIVNDELWNSNFPCADGFIGSSAHDAGNGQFSNDGFFSVNLQECVNYRILFYNFGELPINTVVSNISGPGNMIEHFTANQLANYMYTYIAVRNSDQVIAAESSTADFRSLNGGLYTIYGLYYKSSGPTPPNNTIIANYVGEKFLEFIFTGDCFVNSYNSFQLEVQSLCSIVKITKGIQGVCNPLDNTFTQSFIITFEGSPTGKIIAGSQEFAITTSPQTINYIAQANGSQSFIDVYIDTEENCRTAVNFTAPENCCPFETGIEDNVSGCKNQPLTLTANPDLGTYIWKNEMNITLDTDNDIVVTEDGKYILEITNETGCTKIQEINVVFEQTPFISLPSDVTICDGLDFQINATTNATNIRWLKDGAVVQLGPDKILTVDTAGIYSAEVGTDNCLVSDEIVISVKPGPKPNLGGDKNICEGSSTTLMVENEGTIQWFYNNALISNQTGTSLSITEEGIYKVVVTGNNDCINEDVINVVLSEIPTVDAGNDLEYCEGKTTTINASSSSLIYEWFRNDDEISQPNLSFMVSTPGEYKIIASNIANLNCSAADSIIVIENPSPPADLGTDKVACIGSEVVLTNSSTTGLTFQWFRGGSPISTANELTVSTAGTYTIQVTDSKSCTAIDNINVDFQAGPTVNLNEVNIEFCEGETFEVVATTAATKIEWQRNGATISGQTGKTLTVSQAGNYTILATGSLSGGDECTIEETFNVIVNPKLALQVNDTTACEGEIITLTSNVNAVIYNWFFEGEVVSTSKTYSPTSPGVYTLEVQTNKACKTVNDITVTFSERPGIGLESTGQFCKGEDLTITAQTNGTKFIWFRNNVAIPNALQKTITITQNGTYVFESSFDGDCPRRDTIVVTERPVPIVGLGPDVTLCPNDNVTLDAQNSGAKYKWSTGDTTQQVTINNNTGTVTTRTITVEVTNEFNCIATDAVDVTLRPKVVAKLVSSETGICNGDSLSLTASGGLTYTWSGPAGTFENLEPNVLLVYPKENTTYTVIASDDCPGNRDTISKAVNFFTLKNVSAGNDTCVITGRSIKLKASGGIRYIWEADPSISSGNNTSSPTVAPTEETIYVVTITDSNGCEQIDSVQVCIIEDPLKLIIPVEFITPNEDGFNDKLTFTGLEVFPDNSLLIYNRWGNVVFEKFGYQQDGDLFDGTRNGEPLPPDTYYYVLKFDEYVFKQALTIVREK